jgi:Lrp/AsnC family leucine-responsive transcriptional regulator
LDQIDKQILLYLQDHARVSMTELGKFIGLTQPAVTERVRRMEEKGVIKEYRAMISREIIGKQAMAFILFRATNCAPFYEFCQTSQEVIECHRISGEYNHLLKVITESLPALEIFENKLLNFGKFTTSIALSSPIENKSLIPTLSDDN